MYWYSWVVKIRNTSEAVLRPQYAPSGPYVGGWLDDPPFLGAHFIHFLCKVLGQRSVQKEPF